jgi:arsenate reductase-like glutaredoxin family protein
MLEKDPIQRPDFQQLLEQLEQEGLMQKRLQIFKQVEKLLKFHGIDKEVVNSLTKKI